MAGENHDEIDTILVLELDGPAEEISPISGMFLGALTVGRRVSASSIWSEEYNASKAFDGDESTRWGGAPDSRSGWLEVDLGEEKTFNRVLILENPWDRVRRFQLQYRDGETWRTFHEGTTLGEFHLSFEPIKARYVRLNVLEATDVPTIWEVALFPVAEGEG